MTCMKCLQLSLMGGFQLAVGYLAVISLQQRGQKAPDHFCSWQAGTGLGNA